MEPEVAIASQLPAWARRPGAEPIPGYRLIEPLGRGGFGEVWKCEAPGGLFKAVKFVPNQDESAGPANQERQALQLVKAIRHPFILSLDRVEVVDGVLVIVMELADKSLYALLGDYQAQGLPGIPREELLGYLLEAAEALDWMNFGHGLQHLDIKPHNLFLVSNHLKIADFGLVDRLTDVEKSHPHQTQRQGGITPLYAAPELLRGTVSRHCDQYSLAIVYQQLLTGTVPFWCQNMYQLMLLHLTAEPQLTPLPAEDRPVVARALSKRAADRYPSCLDFMQALVCGEGGARADLPRRASVVKRILSPPPAGEKPPAPPPPAGCADEQRPEPGACATLATGPERPTKTPPFGVPSVLTRAAAGEARGPSLGPAPTCVSLPGYRFLRCVGQTPLGDVWKVEDEQGRPLRALCLHSFVEEDPALIGRLQAFRHPALPPADVVWSPAGRLVLVTPEYEKSLRDRLEECRKAGHPGIPREELLRHLRALAEALDALYAEHGLPHLGLSPRALLLEGGDVRVADFGLVPLVWLPTGQSGGSFNARYAAPELFERPDLTGIPPGEAARAALMGRAGPASDQYSLALIYAELLNGIAPNVPRSGSGAPRRPGRRGGRGDSALVAVRNQPRVDLDLLPTCDRPVFQRALHENPQQRFPSCTALVEALETAANISARRLSLYYRLPPVIPFASLQGEPPPRDVLLPSLDQLVISLAMPNLAAPSPARVIVGPQNIRYTLQGNDVWECKCPVQIFSGALPLKVEGFRAEWRARVAEQRSDAFVFHIDLPAPPAPGEREPVMIRLAFEVEVQSAAGSAKYYAEARMRVRPVGGERERERAARLLPELAPRMFESMRVFLQAGPEQRTQDRWQCPQPLHVYPVRPDLELDEVLDGMSRNVSLGGVSFRVLKEPRAEQIYLHWHKAPGVAPFALLARLVRVQPMPGGGFEAGAAFPEGR